MTKPNGEEPYERQINTGDTCLAWNSLVETVEHGKFTVSALTDHRQLYQESVEMTHAAVIYAEYCHLGRSRIFRIRRGEEHVATGELIQRDGVWTVSQVKGPGNRPVDQETTDAMEATARAYNEAWNDPESEGHQAWKIERDGSEVPGSREQAGTTRHP